MWECGHAGERRRRRGRVAQIWGSEALFCPCLFFITVTITPSVMLGGGYKIAGPLGSLVIILTACATIIQS